MNTLWRSRRLSTGCFIGEANKRQFIVSTDEPEGHLYLGEMRSAQREHYQRDPSRGSRTRYLPRFTIGAEGVCNLDEGFLHVKLMDYMP